MVNVQYANAHETREYISCKKLACAFIATAITATVKLKTDDQNDTDVRNKLTVFV